MSNPPDDPVAPIAVPARIGRYQVLSVLGTGNFGRVFLADDTVLPRRVAIKQPFGDGLKPEYLADFLKEASAAAQIDHQNVCRVYDFGSDGGLPYIVMHYADGGTFNRLLEKRKSPFTTWNAVATASKIARGLAAAHEKNVIHRDLKPANVLYDKNKGEILITDFGLARDAAPTQVAASSSGACGSPSYMPPEQWGTTFGPVTPLADVYSLGIILYEMLTGQVPFTGNSMELMTKHYADAPPPPSVIRSGIDPRVEALCLKALQKNPANRYSSAEAFADALDTI